MLHLRTLGTLELTAADGRPLDAGLTQPKRSALLAYLAISAPRGWRTRDELVALFWPEMDEARARAALRRALHFLRAALGPDVLRTRGDSVSIAGSSLSCDVIQFEQALEEGRPHDAVALHGGELLAGMYVRDAPAFERWLEGERSRLQRLVAEACWTLAELGRDAADPAAATHWTNRALSLDPLDERAQRRGMSILASIGDASGALRAYDAFATHLAREFDVPPSGDTIALAASVRAGCRAHAHASGDGDEALSKSAPPSADDAAPTTDLESSGMQPDAIMAEPSTALEPVPAREHSRAAPTDSTTVSLLSPPPDASPGRAAWRNIRMSIAIPFACLFIIALYTLATTVLADDRRARAAGVDAGAPPRVLILPFTAVGGSEAPLLAHGMVELLSTALDGAGALRVVDQRAVMPLASSDGSDSTIREAAARLGIRFLVQGSVVKLGNRLEARAVLLGGAGATIASSGASGLETELLAVSDDLARQLLGAVNAGPDARLTRLAIHTSDSLAAVKSYLHGMRLLRTGAFGEAADSFRVAVRVDENFALAYYNLSMAIGWASSGRDREATLMAQRAVQHSGALGAHDRALLLAHAQSWGDNPFSAEQLYRQIVASYPDDMDAWYELGEVIFHNGPASGRSALGARDAFQRARHMPGLRPGVRVHLARLAALAGDSAMLRSLATEVRAELAAPADSGADGGTAGSGPATGTPLLVMDARDDELLLLDAVQRRDEAALHSWLATSRMRDDATIWARIWSVARFTGDLRAAERVAQALLTPGRAADVQDLAWLAIAHFRLAGGQPAAALAAVERLSDSRADAALAFRGQLAALPFVPSTALNRAALRDSLSATDGPGGAAWRFSDETAHRGSSVMLGNLAGARLLASPSVIVAQLHQRDSLAGEDVPRDRRFASPGFPVAIVAPASSAGAAPLTAASRLWRADSLLAAGNARDALAWYGSLPETDGYDVIYLALAARGQLRAAAAIGDRASADVARIRLARLWQHAEPAVSGFMNTGRD